MPKKYHIKTRLAPPRFTPVGKFGTIEWGEACLGCMRCAKEWACIYRVRDEESAHIRSIGGLDQFEPLYDCKNCLRCMQECANAIVYRVINPAYRRLGDTYWTADIISSTWGQAETGKIPVSGAGYRGPFVGPGFDRMWTDMSEIVRPTRDGIHGREYINTSVDLGRKVPALTFDAEETLWTEPPRLLEVPMPVLFDTLCLERVNDTVRMAMARAASVLGLFVIVEAEHCDRDLMDHRDHLMPLVHPGSLESYGALLKQVRIAEMGYTGEVMENIQRAKAVNGDLMVSIRVPLDGAADEVVERLTREGAEVIHLCADLQGNDVGAPRPRFIKDRMRAIHRRLVEGGIRDEVTLIASGGIAMAEHMAKIIICGADATTIDLPLLIALECRLCEDCARIQDCPVDIEHVDVNYATQRIVNLMGSWHGQLLEVLGAMGLREVRRLRGEVGRAMFFEDLEAESFGPLFGERVERIPK